MERTRHEKREAEQQKAMCEADAQQAAQDQPTSEPTAGIRPLQGHSTAQTEAEAGREVGIAQEPLAEATATTGIDSAVAELDVDDVLAFATAIANGSADSDGDGTGHGERDGAGEDAYSDSFSDVSFSSESLLSNRDGDNDPDNIAGASAVGKETPRASDTASASADGNDAAMANERRATRDDNEYSEDNEDDDDEQYSDDSFQLDTDIDADTGTDTESENNAEADVQAAAASEPVRVLLVVDK